MSSCQNKSTTQLQFWHFSISKKAQLPAIRILEQPILLTKSKINCTGYKFSKYSTAQKYVNCAYAVYTHIRVCSYAHTRICIRAYSYAYECIYMRVCFSFVIQYHKFPLCCIVV